MGGYDWITFTTDYGLSDGFAAVLHGMVARLAPAVRVIDVTHLLAPGDVRGGATVLAQAIGYLPRAVHVAVVDQGVGTRRRAVAIQTPGGVLVGPDNGLLPGPAQVLGGVTRVVHLTNTDWFTDNVSATFHGRDVFAPVAARLAAGADLGAAGTDADPGSLVRLPEPRILVGDDWIEAEVLMVDRFGNVQLAAPGDAVTALPEHLVVRGVHALRRATFGDVPLGRLIAYADSAGKLALAINGGRAVVALSTHPGDVLRISAAGPPPGSR